MKTKSVVFLIIAAALIFLQFIAYKADNFKIPSLQKRDDIFSELSVNIGSIIGYNLFGFIGLILLIIALSSKSKKNK